MRRVNYLARWRICGKDTKKCYCGVDYRTKNQGWRMRFNSNSVKNSPDYVK